MLKFSVVEMRLTPNILLLMYQYNILLLMFNIVMILSLPGVPLLSNHGQNDDAGNWRRPFTFHKQTEDIDHHNHLSLMSTPSLRKYMQYSKVCRKQLYIREL